MHLFEGDMFFHFRPPRLKISQPANGELGLVVWILWDPIVPGQATEELGYQRDRARHHEVPSHHENTQKLE